MYLIKTADINEEIRDREIRVIGDDGEQLGVMLTKDALAIAQEKKLDLVKIAPNANPPVCRIMDFGKHRYEQQKRNKEARKKQKSVSMKEVRLSLNIEKHDLETKAKNAIKFLEKGDKVKVSLRFKGREMGYTQLGYEVFNKFVAEIDEVGAPEAPARIEGRSLVATLAPKK
ncbi:translation initiation factor IF-3 [Fusibacter sp. 3D3]|uniref:translation initiation factor IF-3 n=1 Tax=Fusibacter sp. 3D3 TaxID=1048380 RepID=UPI000853EB28|nr:translation initiation factor IF-3 [Fusibacter sp. 3D3]GAU77151.1 translation initiation factor 3 [Fusibacter sp. 3D3]